FRRRAEARASPPAEGGSSRAPRSTAGRHRGGRSQTAEVGGREEEEEEEEEGGGPGDGQGGRPTGGRGTRSQPRTEGAPVGEGRGRGKRGPQTRGEEAQGAARRWSRGARQGELRSGGTPSNECTGTPAPPVACRAPGALASSTLPLGPILRMVVMALDSYDLPRALAELAPYRPNYLRVDPARLTAYDRSR
ncbi:unnamed protein product, partial [Prorocentrum cordatum]